nr:hypothetical protein CFP56_50555 [Quercus suber]
MKDLEDLVQRCVECAGEWNVTTRSGVDELRNASLVFSHQQLPITIVFFGLFNSNSHRLKCFMGMGEYKE